MYVFPRGQEKGSGLRLHDSSSLIFCFCFQKMVSRSFRNFVGFRALLGWLLVLLRRWSFWWPEHHEDLYELQVPDMEASHVGSKPNPGKPADR